MSSNTRYIAYKALLRVEKDKAYSNLALDEALGESSLDSRDKAFVSSLFYGVLERRITLDYVIRRFSSVRLKKIEPPVLMILRLSVYQMIFMDKVPDSAAVNEAVKLCKKEKLYRSSSFVNALLRSVTRAEQRLVLPDENDRIKYLSVKYSCPESVVSLWINDYSPEIAEGILGSLFGRPPTYIRVNTLKANEDELTAILAQEKAAAEKTAVANALRVNINGSAAALESHKLGLFHVQDLSSQICCELLGAKPGDIVSDVCAAPGGKSLNIAQRIENGTVYSYDIYEHKIKLINAAAGRLGVKNISAAVRDAASDTPLNMSDKIICDVPCSGLGVLRRKPEIRYKEDMGIDTLPELQLKILENSSQYVKSGGTLIYSTCTLNRRENNDNAALFLKRHAEFEPLKLELPKGIARTIDEEENCLTLFPQMNDTDGFFIAAFKRK